MTRGTLYHGKAALRTSLDHRMYGFLEQAVPRVTISASCPVAGCSPPHRLTASRHPEDALDHLADGSHLVAALCGVVGGELAWLQLGLGSGLGLELRL